MKSIIEAIRRVLRNDVLIVDLVGVDAQGEVKVYDEVAKQDTQPPFYVLSVIPGGDAPGVYGQMYVMQEVNIQLTAWHHEAKDAWQLVDAGESALQEGEYDAGEWELMQVRRSGFAQPLPDRDTNWFQVATPYQLRFSRS